MGTEGQEIGSIFQRGAQIEVQWFQFQFAGLNLGEIQDVVDER